MGIAFQFIVALLSSFVSARQCLELDGDSNRYIECGTTYPIHTERISDGALAQFGHQPWQVALFWRPLYFAVVPDAFFCGGALINEKYVLSAAHCFNHWWLTRHNVIAKLGIHDLDRSSDRYPHREHRIQRIIMHEQFKVETEPGLHAINDITLLELAASVIYRAHIVPICLPEYGSNFENRQAVFSGWGATADDQGPAPSLRRMDVRVVANSVCKGSWRSRIHDTMLCTEDNWEGRTACHGDSGSPLVFFDEDGRAKIIGIASWGVASCRRRLMNPYDVYTNVAHYVRWINEIVNTSSEHIVEETFHCDGTKILRKLVCDGRLDCADKTDEVNCTIYDYRKSKPHLNWRALCLMPCMHTDCDFDEEAVARCPCPANFEGPFCENSIPQALKIQKPSSLQLFVNISGSYVAYKSNLFQIPSRVTRIQGCESEDYVIFHLDGQREYPSLDLENCTAPAPHEEIFKWYPNEKSSGFDEYSLWNAVRNVVTRRRVYGAGLIYLDYAFFVGNTTKLYNLTVGSLWKLMGGGK